MKRKCIFIIVLATILCISFFLLINSFGVIHYFLWSMNHKSISVENTVRFIFKNSNSEALACIENIKFPQEAYVDAYFCEPYPHEENLEDSMRPGTYRLRIVLPKENLEELISSLKSNKFIDVTYDDLTGEKNIYTIDSSFGTYDQEALTYAFERIYGLHWKEYRTTGEISIYIVETQTDCLALISVY